MTKEEALERLEAIAKIQHEQDLEPPEDPRKLLTPEAAHSAAETVLLALVNDEDVAIAYALIRKP